jgi:hypothetical protein
MAATSTSTIVTDTYTSAILFGTELRCSPDGYASSSSSSKPLAVFQVMVSRGQDQWVVLRPHSLFSALHNKVRPPPSPSTFPPPR